MANLAYSDQELIKKLQIDKVILQKFKSIREAIIKEAQELNHKFSKRKKIKVLGISSSAREAGEMARENSNSEELLKRCLEHCHKLGAETELIALRDYEIKYCKACYSTTNTQCHYPCSCYPKGTPQGDDMSNILYEKVLDADAIILATPVNNFRISALLADFIDRCISLDGSLLPADPKNPKNKELNIKQMKFITLNADEKVLGSGLLKRFNGKVGGIIVTGHEEGASMVISNLFMTLTHYGMLFPPYSNMYAMSSVCNSTFEDKPLILNECYFKQARELAENVVKAAKLVKKEHQKWVYDNSEN